MTKKSTNKAGSKAMPDYSFWVAMPTWTRDEAIALLSGHDPDSPSDDVNSNDEKTKIARLLERAFEAGAFPNADRVTPEECLSAMESFGLSAPKALIVAATSNKISIKNWPAEYEKKDAEINRLRKGIESDTTVRTNEKKEANVTALKKIISSLRKALLGLAISKFKLERDWSHSSVVTNITNAIQQSGLNLDKDTVRTHLVDAIEAVGEEVQFHGEV